MLRGPITGALMVVQYPLLEPGSVVAPAKSEYIHTAHDTVHSGRLMVYIYGTAYIRHCYYPHIMVPRAHTTHHTVHYRIQCGTASPSQ